MQMDLGEAAQAGARRLQSGGGQGSGQGARPSAWRRREEKNRGRGEAEQAAAEAALGESGSDAAQWKGSDQEGRGGAIGKGVRGTPEAAAWPWPHVRWRPRQEADGTDWAKDCQHMQWADTR